MSARVNVLAVLYRACGDATGNPVEGGQAYEARAAVVELIEVAQAILARLDMEPREAIFPNSAARDDLRAALARVGGDA